jgi:hypothetical protein
MCYSNCADDAPHRAGLKPVAIRLEAARFHGWLFLLAMIRLFRLREWASVVV